MNPILECRDLYKYFGDCKAIDGINLKLTEGKIIGLLGPNGSGKTTFIKLIAGLLTPIKGQILINGMWPCPQTKAIVSYLPDREYLDNNMKIEDCLNMFKAFFEDFDENKAVEMIEHLNLNPKSRLKTLSKGNKEKVNLIFTMSRNAKLYLLDEPIGGVDPAARDYIISTIINNYNPDAAVIISTHLISEIENILDEVIFLRNGKVILYNSTDALKMKENKSIDKIFREVFICC